MSLPVRTMRMATPMLRAQTSLLQPRYTSLITPSLSTSTSVLTATRISPLSRHFTSPSAPRLASPAASSSHGSHDSGHDSGHGQHGGAEDRSAPGYGLHFHEPSKWHKMGAQLFGGLLWFWLLYRLKNDWKYFFFWENPFDAHDDGGHGHDEHKSDEHH